VNIGKVWTGGLATLMGKLHESKPTIALIINPKDNNRMWIIFLEALGAGLVLVLIVWWTMFSGRNKGEPPDEDK
jgi:hypothetical protein